MCDKERDINRIIEMDEEEYERWIDESLNIIQKEIEGLEEELGTMEQKVEDLFKNEKPKIVD